MIASRCAALGAGFVSLVVVSRALGPGAFGQLSFAIAFVGLLAPMCEFGLNSVVVKALLEEPRRRNAILGTALVIRIVATFVVITIGYAVVRLLRPDDALVQLLVTVLLAAEIFRSMAVFSFGLEAERQFRTIALVNVVIAVTFALAKIAIVFAGGSLEDLVWAYAGEVALFGPAYLLVDRLQRHPGALRFDSEKARSLLPAIGILAVSGVLATVNLRLDQVMIGQMLGDEAAGRYAVAARLSEIWYFVPAMIATVAMPDLVRIKEQFPGELIPRVTRLLDLLMLLGLFVALATLVLAGPAIGILFGEGYAASAPILVVHVWGGVFVAMRALASKWIVLEGVYSMSLLSHGAGALANVGLNLVLIPAMGGMGAALATVASYAIAGYLMFFLHPQTRTIALCMTRSFGAPVRLPLAWIAGRGASRRAGQEG